MFVSVLRGELLDKNAESLTTYTLQVSQLVYDQPRFRWKSLSPLALGENN